MNAKKIKSNRTGRTGWRFRFTDPATRQRTKRTFWFSDKRDAEKAFNQFIEGREAKRIGLPDYAGWEMTYNDLVRQFLAEGQIASEQRRASLKYALELNLLGLQVGAELSDIGKLTGRCRRLLKNTKDVFIRKCVQQPVKQLARWAASVGLLPYDPLAHWKLVARTSRARHRRAFTPEEIRAIFAAADQIDAYLQRQWSSKLVFQMLLLTGNRPSAIYAANVEDLRDDRVQLPPGMGCKRNGAATLPAEFVSELRAYVAARKAKRHDPLLISHKGAKIDLLNMTDDFKRCLALGFVNLAWPANHPFAKEVDVMDVEYFISFDKHRGFDGAPPKDREKIAARERYLEKVQAVADEISERVRQRLEGTDLYCLRKTHISWARRLVNPDSVKVQVGHAPQGIEEKHYLDMVVPGESSQAVWDVLMERRDLNGKVLQSANLQKMVPNVDHKEKNELPSVKSAVSKTLQVIGRTGVKYGVAERTRTADLLSHSQTL